MNPSNTLLPPVMAPASPNAMKPHWTEIVDILRQELAGYGTLLRLFEEQQQQLFARDPEAVLQLGSDIERQVRVLHEVRRGRESLVAAFAGRHGQPVTATLRSLLPHFVAEVQPLIEALIKEINVLIHRVRRASRHNHTLLARAVESHQQTLRTLRPDAFTQTYAPTGRLSLTSAHPAASLRAAG
jgi:flagellar biosynthesis/type III secretory pathway chaperone